MEKTSYAETRSSDEIDLKELWEILWQQKLTLGLFSLVPVALTLIYYIIFGFTYRYEFYVHPITLKFSKAEIPFPDRGVFVAELKILEKKARKTNYREIPAFKIVNERSQDNFIAIEVKGKSREEVRKKAETVVNALVSREVVATYKKIFRDLSEQQIRYLRSDRELMAKVKEALRQGRQLNLGFDIFETDIEWQQREQLLKDLVGNFEILRVEYGDLPEEPDYQSGKLVIMASFMAGLFLGVFVALIRAKWFVKDG
ncbi:MAG: hypothetical protein NZM25_00970 [Leptospiraceae bacterium]|nr:hypothetical protein [Leptospiraceae bacterium]MDW8306295.1 hypothetical protein [Leptospiraceae bacterium]